MYASVFCVVAACEAFLRAAVWIAGCYFLAREGSNPGREACDVCIGAAFCLAAICYTKIRIYSVVVTTGNVYGHEVSEAHSSYNPASFSDN